VDLDHLRTFAAIYRTASLTRAAEVLHMSQPGVTQHLKALEAEIGRPLFTRLARGVAPTPLGDALAREVAGPLDALNVITETFLGGGEPRATLFLGGPADCLAARVVPSLVPLTNQGLRVRAITGLTKDLIARLGDGDLDLVVATTPSEHRNVTLTPFFDEILALVASPACATRLELSRLERDPRVLVDVPLISYADSLPLIRRYWRTQFPETHPPRAQIVLDDLRGITATVEADGGIAVVPSYLVRQQLRVGTLVLIHHPRTPPRNTLYLARRSSRHDAHITAIADHLRRLATTW
jgi:DNA-binding transcriptional LysR family regulator